MAVGKVVGIIAAWIIKLNGDDLQPMKPSTTVQSREEARSIRLSTRQRDKDL